MNRSSTLRKRAFEGAFGLEGLETRQLLAADLEVAWDSANFHVPTVLVPGDHVDPLGGVNRIELPIQIANQGPAVANGNVRIDFYLSLDSSLSVSPADILIKSYPGELLTLPVFTGDPNDIGTFSPDMVIPASTPPGTYFAKVRIIPNIAIGDPNSGNNIAVTAGTVDVARKFGTFSGRTNVSMTLQDADGTAVTFSQTGSGSGDVIVVPSGFGVTLTGADGTTATAISASGGDGVYDLASVAITGSVASFSAPQGRLRGALTTTTGFGAMTFGDVVGPLTITVPGTSASPSFTFGAVNELTLDSAVGINSIAVTSWGDFAGPADHIAAPWLGSLSSTLNFYPSIFLSGRTGAPTLGDVTMNGVIKRGSWSINGSGTTLNVFAATVFWSASYAGAVTSLTTVGSFRGVFTASTIGAISSGRDILLSRIMAGAYLGADGALGGTGANADTYGAGTIGTIDVVHNIAGVTIAAGLDPVDGVLSNGNDQLIGGTTSRIGRITVGHLIGAFARIVTNVYSGPITIAGVAQDWRFNQRYSLSTTPPTVTMQSAMVTDVGGVPTATVVVRYSTTGLMNLTSIVDGVVRIAGPGGFLGFGVLSTKSFDGPTHQQAAFATFTVNLGPAGMPATPGTYTLSAVGNGASDGRGNFVPAGVIDFFDV